MAEFIEIRFLYCPLVFLDEKFFPQKKGGRRRSNKGTNWHLFRHKLTELFPTWIQSKTVMTTRHFRKRTNKTDKQEQTSSHCRVFLTEGEEESSRILFQSFPDTRTSRFKCAVKVLKGDELKLKKIRETFQEIILEEVEVDLS